MRAARRNVEVFYEKARLTSADLLALYDLLTSNWQAHTFEIGSYEVDSRDELISAFAAAQPDRIFFSGSHPTDGGSGPSFVALRIESDGEAHITAWNDQHIASLAFVKMCEQALDRCKAVRRPRATYETLQQAGQETEQTTERTQSSQEDLRDHPLADSGTHYQNPYNKDPNKTDLERRSAIAKPTRSWGWLPEIFRDSISHVLGGILLLVVVGLLAWLGIELSKH